MFNNKTRENNIKNIVLSSGISSFANVILQFLFRTIFLNILTKEYLGIEGLFTNILQVLSLAELGIGVIISYKLYEPIKSHSVNEVAGLMRFYKKIYFMIAMFILILGLLMMPFLQLLISDINEIPSDVSLYLVFFLFLGQSVSSYFFTYKQTLLIADQRGDTVILFNMMVAFLKTGTQLIVLFFTRDYQVMLLTAILVNITLNWIFSVYITRQYREIFAVRTQISTDIKRDIFCGTRAMFVHRIGGTVLNASDNIILSMFLGLGQLGIYSNYSLIIVNLNKLMRQLLGNFTATIGNAYISLSEQENYKLYKKFLKINLLLANFTTLGIYIFITPFMQFWQGKEMLLDKKIVIVLAISYYLEAARIINTSFTNACGLFKRDIFRSLIEAGINIVVSVALAWKYGMIGVFVGTIVSCLVTVWWREPYLLYKHIFHNQFRYYWFEYIKFTMLLVAECTLFEGIARLLGNI